MSERVISRWDELFALALPALDLVFGAATDETRPPAWTLGGGTAIALRLDHRISHDVDIFVPGVPLRLFTPAQNPAAKAISTRFQWPGHYLKFERPEGEVDFLSPALQTVPGYSWADFKGRRFALETAEEVIVKKIRYRSSRFTERDLFDLAVVAQALPDLARVLAAEVPDALGRVKERVALHRKTGVDTLNRAIIPTAAYQDFAPLAFDIAAQTLHAAQVLASAAGNG